MLQRQDGLLDQFERQQLEEKGSASAAGVHKFLHEALSTKQAKEMLRRANQMADKKQGRNAGMGWALEDLLRAQGPVAPKGLGGSGVVGKQQGHAKKVGGKSKKNAASATVTASAIAQATQAQDE